MRLAVVAAAALVASAVAVEFDFGPSPNTYECAANGQVISGVKEGVIVDSVAETVYKSDQDCSWTIEAYPEGSKDYSKGTELTLSLSFRKFDLEDVVSSGPSAAPKCFDWVKIYEACGPDETKLHGNIYCGKALPPLVETTGRCLHVVFHTDSTRHGEGLEAKFHVQIRKAVTLSQLLVNQQSQISDRTSELLRQVNRVKKSLNASLVRMGALGESVSGPAGTKGPTGERGDQGPKGPRGVRGDDNFVKGPRGHAGPVGRAGGKGADGDDGKDGSRGPRGSAGATGPQGIQAKWTGEEPDLKAAFPMAVIRGLANRLQEIVSKRPDVGDAMAKQVGDKMKWGVDHDAKKPYNESAISAIIDALEDMPNKQADLIQQATADDKLSRDALVRIFPVAALKAWGNSVFGTKPRKAHAIRFPLNAKGHTDGKKPVACCKGMTAACLACSAKMSVELYCKSNPKTQGCPDNNPAVCCQSMTASCLACTERVTVAQYCKKFPETQGCPQTGLISHGAMQSMQDDASEDPDFEGSDGPAAPHGACDQVEYAKCMEKVVTAPLNHNDPRSVCAEQRASYSCLQLSQCASDPIYKESVQTVRRYMREWNCQEISDSAGLIAEWNCNDGPLGYSPDGGHECGCDSGDSKVRLEPSRNISSGAKPGWKCVAPMSFSNAVYPENGCEQRVVTNARTCIASHKQGNSFCEKCAPYFQVVEWCVQAGFPSTSKSTAEETIDQIWKSKCLHVEATSAAK